MPERQLAYETIRNKKNEGFIVTAPSLQRLYIDSALAITDLIVDIDQVQELDKQIVSITGENKEKLMIAWLNAVVALFESERFLSKRIVFNSFDGKKITASLFGERYDAIRHGHPTDIKSSYEKVVEMGDSPREENQFFVKVEIKN